MEDAIVVTISVIIPAAQFPESIKILGDMATMLGPWTYEAKAFTKVH